MGGQLELRSHILNIPSFKTDDIRKLLHEDLIPQLMNSSDYYVNLRLIVFISLCFQI